jgi:hypothetical protein
MRAGSDRIQEDDGAEFDAADDGAPAEDLSIVERSLVSAKAAIVDSMSAGTL